MSEEVYNKEDLLNHLQQIAPAGFTMDADGTYVKQEANRTIEIDFSTNNYFPHSVEFLSISVLIKFPAVEQILYQVWSSLPEPKIGLSGEEFTFHKAFGPDVLGQSVFDEMRSKEVDDDSSFNIIKPKLESLIAAGVSFVNQYQTLQNLYDFGETLSEDDQLSFYINTESDRMAVVKKLLNLPYSSFLQNEITLYTQAGWTEEATFTAAIKSHLDNL